MKGLGDDPAYTVQLLDGGVTFADFIDGHICDRALVEKSAFVVGDLGAVVRQHARWRAAAPHLRPYFPLRCNSCPALLRLLASLQLGFICSSKMELKLALEHGAPPDSIVVSGVCKPLALIKDAARNKVQHLVCENEAELDKISRLHPEAKLLLQLSTPAHAAETSMQFGSSLKSCRHLLEAARKRGVGVVGVAFHVPGSCRDLPQAYSRALADARCVFDMAEDLGFHMTMLDIGGGFTGSELQLKQVDSALRPLLNAHFPPQCGVQLLAEPGSFYVASAFSLAVNVIAKEVVRRRWNCWSAGESGGGPEFLYYMNEGVYGPFGFKLLGNAVPAPSVHKYVACSGGAVYPSSLWGPSLDQLDQVVERCLLPELSVGDWLLFSNMGACGLDRRGPAQLPVYYAVSTSDWMDMQDAGVMVDSVGEMLSLVSNS